MSKKKKKKRNSNSYVMDKDPLKLQQTSSAKRLDTLPRNLLLSDLVLMAASQMMLDNGMISQTVADIVGIIGVIMLITALFLLFGPKNRTGGGTTL